MRLKEDGYKIDRDVDIGWIDLAPVRKKYRIKYLWFRVRCVYNMIKFILAMQDH